MIGGQVKERVRFAVRGDVSHNVRRMTLTSVLHKAIDKVQLDAMSIRSLREAVEDMVRFANKGV